MKYNCTSGAESFRRILVHGSYAEIDSVLGIIQQDGYSLLEYLTREAGLSPSGQVKLPSFLGSPETVYSHYAFWKAVSLLKEKPPWFYQFESFDLRALTSDEPFRFPPGICQCPGLKSIILKDMNLEEIPQEIFNIRKLSVLDLSGNRISTIPPGIGRLRQLLYFNVAGNNLEHLPEQMKGLHKLQILNISGNRIRILPFSLDSMRTLRHLDLSCNCLDQLPRGLHSLYQLEKLVLSYNDLSAQEEALWENAYFSLIPGYQQPLPFLNWMER